jgi:hypothetical protein
LREYQLERIETIFEKDTRTHFSLISSKDKKKANKKRLAHTDHNGNFTTWCSDYLAKRQIVNFKSCKEWGSYGTIVLNVLRQW